MISLSAYMIQKRKILARRNITYCKIFRKRMEEKAEG